MTGTVWLEERLLVCKRLLIVWRWTCSTQAESGLCDDVVECHCVPLGCAVLLAVCGLPVGFRWLVEISWRIGLL